MSVIFVRPGHPMGLGEKRLALYEPLSTGSAGVSTSGVGLTLVQVVSGAAGWWDAGSPGGLLGPGNTPTTAWNSPGNALIDLSGNGRNLVPYYDVTSSRLPEAFPHLSGILGGVGYPVTTPGLLQPALDAHAGWQLPSPTPSAVLGWTLYLVWSRPNWRQGSGHDAQPITLLTIGSQAVLQVDGSAGTNRLILFPGAGQAVVKSIIARRHTHSIIVRYSPVSGTDLWLDDIRVVQSVPWPASISFGSVLLLHDSTPFGAAQCWLHEGAEWDRALSDGEIAALNNYAGRWFRGVRRGLYLIVNGQSNAINYSLNDGAADLLVRGLAWYLGALAYNILATTGTPNDYTMQNGEGIYAVASAGYPGSFVMDPSDGSSPSGWSLGADGHAVQAAVGQLPAEDLSDVCAIIWPWNETDSLRQYTEYNTFKSATLRFLNLLRNMFNDTVNRIPLVWWNAIPYGLPDGITMHRQVVQDIASISGQNVVVGNPQTSDSNPRGSAWDPTTGIATGGDPSHRDSADNRRFAMLASPVVARAIIASGYSDSVAALPAAVPRVGGPTITHVYRLSNTTLILTVNHDAGNDLKVPLQAACGAGFAVMDGGTSGNDGPIVLATVCQRIDSTHLKVVLNSAIQNVSRACHLFYPFGPAQIGRGNAVTDNFSEIAMPTGWNIGSDLGASWSLDFPLAATFSGITLSDTPG